MEQQKSTERLASLVIKTAGAAIIVAVCWYFRSTLIYIVLAAVVALICRPIARAMKKIRIKGKSAPDWIVAIFSLILFMLILVEIIVQMVPVVSSIIQSVSDNLQSSSLNASVIARWLEQANVWIIDRFPKVGRDFRIQDAFMTWIGNAFDISSVTSVVGSFASAMGSLGIGLFSVIFIGFFFVKDETLFRKIVGSLVPDKVEDKAIKAIGEIEHLLSRYFVGLIIEVLGVALLDFLGLWLIAGIGLYPALGIASIAGILNIIPYVGPWIGCAIGTTLGMVIKFSSAAVIGVYPNFAIVVVTFLAVFIVTQLVDNFFFQPMIYSTSIKSSPLEIFIVLLMAGHVGGVLGMLVAIPSYTIIRVIASRFLEDAKPVKRLMEATGD